MAFPHESADDEKSVGDGIIWLSDEEGRDYFDQTARDLLGMSGDEFIRRLNAGGLEDVIDDGEHNDHLWLAMMRRTFVVGSDPTRSSGAHFAS